MSIPRSRQSHRSNGCGQNHCRRLFCNETSPMTPRFRKFVLFTHITFSVGWFGAVVPYLALTIAGLASHDAQVVRAAYVSMDFIGWFVIVPFSIAALLTGLVQSLG